MPPSTILRSMAARPSIMLRLPHARLPRNRFTYATTTKGDTQNASNVGNTPTSDSAAEGDVKSSRSLESDGVRQESGSSVAQPASQDKLDSGTGTTEEGGDPSKEMGSKIEEKGRNTPLDPADK